ncbi:S8 family peptidase [Aquimonas sp.]|jgi:subtilisin family serine protease|uniref:S8 family peptidase n=1 Tax=Aquimonas sp. TaxID=1872588 RepID=UPI0037C0A1E5
MQPKYCPASPLSLSLCLALSALAGTASAGELRTVGTPVPGNYIVVLKPSAARLGGQSGSLPTTAAVARELATRHRATLLFSYDRALRGFSVRAEEAALARLLADPRVAWVQQDSVVEASTPTPGVAASWGQDRIDQRTLPLDNLYGPPSYGAGVHAYVIDSGVRGGHIEFDGRMGQGHAVIVDGYGTGDCIGHGTHVAGTLAGSAVGVAPQATVHPVRVFGCEPYTATSTIIAGIDWVIANRELPAVANLSLGGLANGAMDTAIANLVASGVTTVVAAGNSYADACLYSPARAPQAITVASSTPDDVRSWFSNHGSCVDLYAPGSGITSAWHTGDTEYMPLNGTSMAAPHVAGVAALKLERRPNATPTEVAEMIRESATPAINDAGFTNLPQPLLYANGDDQVRLVHQQSDASGKITIGLFQRNVDIARGQHLEVAIEVPDGWAVIGGGAEGELLPTGHLLTASYPEAGYGAWRISTSEHLSPHPAEIRGWAIAMKIEGWSRSSLMRQLTVVPATSDTASQPDAVAYLPAGYTLLGGGFRIQTEGVGSFATLSAPVPNPLSANIRSLPGWQARAKDHLQSSPATVTAYAIGIRSTINGVGNVHSTIDQATAPATAHPQAAVDVPTGYARSGCGAFLDWSGAGSLLWRIQPTFGEQGAGCTLSAKDHLTPSPAGLLGYAIGVRVF